MAGSQRSEEVAESRKTFYEMCVDDMLMWQANEFEDQLNKCIRPKTYMPEPKYCIVYRFKAYGGMFCGMYKWCFMEAWVIQLIMVLFRCWGIHASSDPELIKTWNRRNLVTFFLGNKGLMYAFQIYHTLWRCHGETNKEIESSKAQKLNPCRHSRGAVKKGFL